MSDVKEIVIEPVLQFFKDSAYLVKKCTKPDAKGKKINKNLIKIDLIHAYYIWNWWDQIFFVLILII